MAENDKNVSNITIPDGEAPKKTDKERKETRRSYRVLIESASRFEEVEPNEINPRQFHKCLNRSSELFRDVDTPQEAVLDANVFKQLSRLTREQVEILSTNSLKFSNLDFAERLSSYLEHNGITHPKHYKLLGNIVQHAFPLAPALTYLHGSFEAGPRESPEKKPRQARKSGAFDLGPATQTEDGKAQDNETVASLTEMLVESTFKQLQEAYEENDRNPIPYFALILDPTSFSKSVENMFHFSFLVKEGKAAFNLDQNGEGLPFVRPIRVRKSEKERTATGRSDQETRHQAVLSLTYDDWEDMVEIMEIKEPMIKHNLDTLKRKRREMARKVQN